jgi:hypothetical protein
MPKRRKEQGDLKLLALLEEFGGRLVSPGGAAGLLGLTRQTIYTLCQNGQMRSFASDVVDERFGPFGLLKESGPRWVYIPLDDVYAYAEKVGRPLKLD